jgi:hypothetical protein
MREKDSGTAVQQSQCDAVTFGFGTIAEGIP